MKTTCAAPSHSDLDAEKPIVSGNLKYYPHFDAPLRISEIIKIINDPEKVKTNAFFPLIQYEIKYQPYRTLKNKSRPKPKIRKIRYASRRDSYIYAKYRRILMPLYEKHLDEDSISEIPTAYRKILDQNGKGKCNIDFAKDAFDCIIDYQSCFVITLDISKFFESLDHKKIEKIWVNLLGVNSLPPDHKAVFKSLTQYRWVDKKAAYKRLGYFGTKTNKSGKIVQGYLKPYDEVKRQLCKPKEFREKICGKGKLDSIVQKNKHSYGIPQGTPISDLIANMYMIGFDQFIKKAVSDFDGKAYRYSDDIMLIIKSDKVKDAYALEDSVRTKISYYGAKLKIKEEKSSIHKFHLNNEGKLTFKHIKGAGKNGLEYLGFRFDGQRVFLRDSTLSNLKRKITFSAKAKCKAHKKRFSNRSPKELVDSFNYDQFFQNFLRVEEFDYNTPVKKWTFWTYLKRSAEVFGPLGVSMTKQLKFFKSDACKIIEHELNK